VVLLSEACGIAYSKKVKDLTDADLEKNPRPNRSAHH